MDLDTIRALFDYNRWVNELLLAAVERVPPERLHEPLGGSFDSIHGTLDHILRCQISWLSGWRGDTPPQSFSGDDVSDLAAIRRRWAANEREMDAFLAGLSAERLAAPGRSKWPLWQQMLHVVNHGTHHRAELADLLTRAGFPPPQTDLIIYFNGGIDPRNGKSVSSPAPTSAASA